MPGDALLKNSCLLPGVSCWLAISLGQPLAWSNQKVDVIVKDKYHEGNE